MKDYGKMSDFEVNKAVIAFSCAYADVDIVQHPHHADGVSVGLYRACGDYYEWFDYCNNPSDAWPIMVESNIATRPLYVRDNKGRKIVEWEAKFTERDFPRNTIGWDDQNPLRAAMIVYLMMKDEEQ